MKWSPQQSEESDINASCEDSWWSDEASGTCDRSGRTCVPGWTIIMVSNNLIILLKAHLVEVEVWRFGLIPSCSEGISSEVRVVDGDCGVIQNFLAVHNLELCLELVKAWCVYAEIRIINRGIWNTDVGSVNPVESKSFFFSCSLDCSINAISSYESYWFQDAIEPVSVTCASLVGGPSCLEACCVAISVETDLCGFIVVSKNTSLA